MSGTRRKYSKEFKLEAIRMSESGERSISEIERELGISNGLLWKWKESWNKQNKKQEAFPGQWKSDRNRSPYTPVRTGNLVIEAG